MLTLALLMFLAAGDPVKGKDLFQTCAGCHNVTTDARKMGPSLRSLFGKVTLRNGRRVSDENVREIVLDGFNGMPPFRYSFRPAEIEDLMAYLHTLNGKPAEAPASKGEGYFHAYCQRCHKPADFARDSRPEWTALIDDGHNGAPALKDWLDQPSRQSLMNYIKGLAERDR